MYLVSTGCADRDPIVAMRDDLKNRIERLEMRVTQSAFMNADPNRVITQSGGRVVVMALPKCAGVLARPGSRRMQEHKDGEK
jgi:hypothetical protein